MNKVVLLLLLSTLSHPALLHAEDPHAHHRKMMQSDSYKRSMVDYQLPGVELQNKHGNKASFEQFLQHDKTIVLNFIFTSCPTICPVLSAVFSQSQDLFAKEEAHVQLVSISIDPEHDTPSRLLEYANKFNAHDDWQFLTGALSDIVKIQKSFNIYRGNKMNHIPATFILTPHSKQWLRIEGFTNARQLLDEYHRLHNKQ